jgi:hypothetical protein
VPEENVVGNKVQLGYQQGKTDRERQLQNLAVIVVKLQANIAHLPGKMLQAT